MSRGPRTEEGKAIVAANAVKHGLRALNPVIPGEHREDWEAHRDGMVESLSPEGHLETVLAERAALLLWRLARVARYEASLSVAAHAMVPIDAAKYATYRYQGEADIDHARRYAEADLADEKTLDKIMRYESHLNRHLTSTLHELEALQSRRRGQAAPLARVDVVGLPEG